MPFRGMVPGLLHRRGTYWGWQGIIKLWLAPLQTCPWRASQIRCSGTHWQREPSDSYRQNSCLPPYSTLWTSCCPSPSRWMLLIWSSELSSLKWSNGKTSSDLYQLKANISRDEVCWGGKGSTDHKVSTFYLLSPWPLLYSGKHSLRWMSKAKDTNAMVTRFLVPSPLWLLQR